MREADGERILVVEPEGDIALVMETVLRDEGYTTQVVRGLPLASHIAAQPADLVILDVYSALKSGNRQVADLVPEVSGRKIPILCVSTDAGAMTRLARDPRVVGTLAMPFDIETLLANVKRALSHLDTTGRGEDPRAA